MIFCDRNGRAVFWVADNTRLIDVHGHSHGLVEGTDVYDFQGNHRGWYLDGVLRDHSGRVVAFWSELRYPPPTCPIFPILHLPFPVDPVPEVFPTMPLLGVSPIPPQLHMDWSDIDPLKWLV